MARIALRFHSGVLQRHIKVQVFLPSAAYDVGEQSGLAGPICYLLHDLCGGEEDWRVHTAVERYAEETNVALVFPAIENSCGINMPYGDPYADFLALELPEKLAAIFGRKAAAGQRYVAGCGFGGYAAMHLALLYPERYRAAVSICGVAAGSFRETGKTRKIAEKYAIYAWGDTGDVLHTANDLYCQLDERLKEKQALPDMLLLMGEKSPLKPAQDRFVAYAADHGVTLQSEIVPGAQDWATIDECVHYAMNWMKERGVAS